MFSRFTLPLSVGLLSVWASAASAEHSWKIWEAELQRQCPNNHVEWICDGCYDDLLADFIQTLPPAAQQKISTIADYTNRCAMEIGGFSCEMSVNLDAFRKLGLMKQFVAFGCQHYKCEAASLCDRIDVQYKKR